MTVLAILSLAVLVFGLVYVRARMLTWVVVAAASTVLFVGLPQFSLFPTSVAAMLTAVLLLGYIKPLRLVTIDSYEALVGSRAARGNHNRRASRSDP